MSHENAGLRLTGEGYLRRTNLAGEQPVIGPLPLEYIGARPQANRQVVMDTRREQRGVPLHAVIDPQEPAGQLSILSVPRKVLAMALLGREIAVSQGSGNASAEEHAFVADFGVQLNFEHIASLVVTSGEAASLDTGVEGNDNAITWTAQAKGTGGNSIRVALVDPGVADQSLSVAVSGNDITVNLATNSVPAITSTAAEVMAAIAADTDAAALVAVADKGTSDGAGVVAAVAQTNLSGGSTAGTTYTLDTDYEILDAKEGIWRPLSGGSMGASGTCFCTYAYGTIGGNAVAMGGDATIEVFVKFSSVNDLASDAGTTGDDMRVRGRRMLLTPREEINLAGNQPVKAQFDCLPLEPAAGEAFELQWPEYA